MRWWRRVHAAIFVAAATLVYCGVVSAEPVWIGGDGDTHFIFFSGSDLWSDGSFAYGGLLWSPHGTDRSGFTFKALLSGGLYRYNAGDLGGARVVGTELSGQLLPGWRFKRDRFEFTVFLGPELQHNWLRPDDPGNSLHGSKLGARFRIELWNEPTSATMLAADVSLSTIDTDYCARLAYGWKVFDRFYTGPETQVYGGDGYRQLRFGLHVTGLKFGAAEWSLAGGWAFTTDDRDGPYLRLGFMVRR
jgi:Cellulose biosynthesis protein BcsS